MSSLRKNICLLTFTLILSLFLASCGGEKEDAVSALKPNTDDEPASPSVEMEGTVTETGERLMVKVTKSKYTSGPHIVLINDGTVITDANGNSLSLKDIKVGDRLKILYSGQVMLSYPPQIVALHIVVR